MALLGTLVNAGAIVAGALIGLFLSKMREQISDTIMQAIGIVVLVIGLSMALETDNFVALLLSVVFGGIIGSWLKLEERLNNFGKRVEQKFEGKRPFATSFVSGTLLYCAGAMAIVGAINSGLQGDHQVLYTKALLDGFTAVIFSATLGIGVIFAAVPVFLYQGSIALAAEWITWFIAEDLLDQIILHVTSVGGLLIVGLGINLLRAATIRVADFLPALPLAVVSAFLMHVL
ncbi:DUF554 domain-containing protein [Novibacillus thermophilus]|jgi:uncharacterized membrane protein YqgA involved in biofilm formation|uniref:DUF554 domain-containing protein n=1 Tax=Novibacillus thermophilus TaxID=1471761 RepID=A0A1U9K908_9BACL|nr:DUF554 domain-containing protein [Novibacillus thermophilus]AQS56522.1 hypothetical protein B0W44_12875 [Novibacillus thermophilus]